MAFKIDGLCASAALPLYSETSIAHDILIMHILTLESEPHKAVLCKISAQLLVGPSRKK